MKYHYLAELGYMIIGCGVANQLQHNDEIGKKAPWLVYFLIFGLTWPITLAIRVGNLIAGNMLTK